MPSEGIFQIYAGDKILYVIVTMQLSKIYHSLQECTQEGSHKG